jgi:uncharacterized Tic20 family protein
MNTSLTTEERIWAVLSHLSSLAFGMGILLPIIGWSDQRRKSNYSSIQSLQALGYQSLGFTIWILSYLIIFIAALIVLVVMSFQAENTGKGFNSFFGPGAIFLFGIVFGFFAIYFVLPIIAAVACAFGKDFRYPIMGDRLARYLEYESAQRADEQAWLNEDHEFRWVAAMGHFSILIILWGMLAPLTAWILYGKHSLFLKFQAVQTLVYQAGVITLYFGTVFLYLFGIMIISLAAMMGWTGNVRMDSPIGIVGIIFLGGSLLVTLIVLLVVPLLHILGQWAGYRVLKGDDYRYPVVGMLVDKWISSQS